MRHRKLLEYIRAAWGGREDLIVGVSGPATVMEAQVISCVALIRRVQKMGVEKGEGVLAYYSRGYDGIVVLDSSGVKYRISERDLGFSSKHIYALYYSMVRELGEVKVVSGGKIKEGELDLEDYKDSIGLQERYVVVVGEEVLKLERLESGWKLVGVSGEREPMWVGAEILHGRYSKRYKKYCRVEKDVYVLKKTKERGWKLGYLLEVKEGVGVSVVKERGVWEVRYYVRDYYLKEGAILFVNAKVQGKMIMKKVGVQGFLCYRNGVKGLIGIW